MRNMRRFIGIVVLSGLLMFALGSFYHFSVTKNLLLIAWSLMFSLTAFLAVYKHSKEVLSAKEYARQFWLFAKYTSLVPIMIVLVLLYDLLTGGVSALIVYFYGNIVITYYAIGAILSLGRLVSVENSIYHKLKMLFMKKGHS